MATVTIQSTDYDTYADVATANEFLAADFDATLWRDETESDQKGRALVTSTRLLNRLLWAGTKTDADQLGAWPRTGTGLSDVVDDEIPQEIVDASIVLAKLIHAGSKVDSSPTTLSNVRRQRAGSVEIEYFFPSEDPSRLPVEVLELVARFLGGPAFAGVIASGTCGESITCNNFDPGMGA